MKRFLWLVAFTITFLINSCDIDPEIDIIGDCGELDLQDGYLVLRDSVMYFAPYFNPNNSNQFVFIEQKSNDLIKWLCIYDITTKEKKYLCDEVDFNPRWTINNWIVFNRGGEIWKIKTTGDSLTQLFTGYNKYNLQVNPRGDRIIFRESNDYYTTYLADLNGNLLDSVSDQYFGEGSWSRDGLKITCKLATGGQYYTGGSFGYYDTTLRIFNDVYLSTSEETKDRILDTEWLPDSKNVLWLAGTEYQITDIESKETSLFLRECETNIKLWPNYSNDGSKIIWERNYKESKNNGYELYWETQIVITDSDVKNEIQILPN